MTKKDFREQVEKELQGLSRDQTVQFAWRCAVRALPFLGAKGDFRFWQERAVQKYLYSVLYAIDIAYSDAAYSDAAYSADAAAAAYAAYTAATSYAADAAAADAAYAATSAADAATSSAAADAADAAAASAASASAASASAYVNRFRLIILEDIKSIKQSGHQTSSIESYGVIWDKFQLALKNEGCAYWGRLYQSIFENNFEIDRKALQQRINVPKEIRAQGAAAVANYLEALEQKGAKRLDEARIIILGDKGVGKTCVARRLIDPDAPMTTDDESTPGVNTAKWNVKDGEDEINVGIWDFAGHTVTHAVHQFFLSERCLYIMVYDGRTEERNRLDYWLNHMKNFGGNSQAMILVNKRDQHSVDIPINSLREQYPIAGFYEFSVQDDTEKLEQFRNEVAKYIRTNPSWAKQSIPESYYKVKEELEGYFSKGNKEKAKEHIKKEEFEAIAQRNGIDNTEQLLKDLHALGVSLWYKEMQDYDTLVLNPEWISHGVYKIINWVNNAKKHDLSLDDFAKVFQDELERYPIGKSHGFLFNLMKHYELAYETESGTRLIIPHLLKEDRPAELPTFLIGESLQIQYKAEQLLPPNTISRFIVRHHQQIKAGDQVWRYGVVLEDGKGTLALVREDDRAISVSVKGRDATNYLDELRNTLNDIFNSYKSKKPELQYRIVRYGEIPAQVSQSNELWLPESKIVNHLNLDEPYFDDVTGQRLPLRGTAIQYNIKADTVLMGQSQVHHLTQNTFNFKDCNIDLQGSLNDLSQLLAKNGNTQEAKQLADTALLLEEAETIESKDEIKKKGIANRLKRLVENLGDEDSKLHKVVKGIEHGVEIAQDIGKYYNSIAQWVGLPIVPKPLLGEDKKEEKNE